MRELFQAPDVRDRLTLGLTPPTPVADQIAVTARGLHGALGLSGRMVATAQLSVSLHGLGDHAGVRRDIVQMAMEAAAAVPHPGPLDLCFDRAEVQIAAKGRFDLVLKSSQPLVALRAFQHALGHTMACSGLGRLVDRPFEPQIVVIENVRRLGEAAIAPIVWTASSMVLLHTLLGCPEQIPLARWSLLPPEPQTDA